MNFVQFHIGDWDSSTRLLSPLEKGVYIDLLFLYYSLERPLMRSECERIARAYSEDEKAALEYILDRFFMADGDVYRHQRCDKEIELTHAKSAKAAASAKARWEREKANAAHKNLSVENGIKDAIGMPSQMPTDMRSECERNADAMLTDNRKPITNMEEEAKASSRRFLEKPTLELAPTSQPKKAPGIPFQRIVDIYNTKLGQQLGVCRQLNSKRESLLRARYHDVSIAIESTDQAEVLDGFGQYYDKIARSDFLMGRKTDFRASFDWIHQSSNYLKIYEGNYENGRR